MLPRDALLLSMLKTRMRWHDQRQAVLAENVANADTPHFQARDVAPPRFEAPLASGLARTHIRHVATFGARAEPLDPRRVDSFEMTPRRNAVVLEDEMLKAGQNAQDFQAAATLYQRGLGLLRAAIGRRG